MLINADLTQRVVLQTETMSWVPSPLPGVHRKMLERDGGEVARATSLVRYDADSAFDEHEHGGGEEFLVLDGTFSDEAGDYPAGTYVRNPPGSRHAPFSKTGCTLFVKLRQSAPDDGAHVVIDTRHATWLPGRVAGIEVLPLHSHGPETAVLLRWAPGIAYPRHSHPSGEELLVLEGALEDEQGRYPRGTWVRSPPGSAHTPSSREGCLLYVKDGHLAGAGATPQHPAEARAPIPAASRRG